MAPLAFEDSLESFSRITRELSSSPDLALRDTYTEITPRDDLLQPDLQSRDAHPAIDSDLNTRGLLLSRQSSGDPTIVPATYINSNPGANGGEVAGIVLGVTFGIILVLWIISSLRANPFRPVVGTSSVVDVGRNKAERAERRSRATRTKSTSRRTARSRSKSAVSREEMSEVVASRRERGGGGGGGGGNGRSPRRARETVIVEESRRESRAPPPPPDDGYDDDIVEVIEEEDDYSPVRRPRGYRNDGYGDGPRSIRSMRR